MKKYKIEIKWAIIFTITALAWMLLERLTGLHSGHIDKHAAYTNFFAIPAIAVYVFALLDKRKNFYGGIMTYKQGFVCGLIITVIVTLLNPLAQWIIASVISPGYYSNAINYVVDAGKMTQDEAEAYFNLRSYIQFGFIGTPVMGLFTTVIVAIFTRSKTQPGD